MELRVLEQKKKSLKLEVVNPDDTVIYPLINHLLTEDAVVDARYITGHPLLDKPSILVRVKEGEPKEVMKKVARALARSYKAIEKKVEQVPKAQETSK